MLFGNISLKYKDLKLIGEGTFAKVYKAINNETSEVVSIKKASKTSFNLTPILYELNHPNILKIIEISECENFYYVVTEYIPGNDLQQLLSDGTSILTEDVVKHLFIQIFEGIRYLHNKGYAHRDLKLENIIVTPDNKAVIIDFDFCIENTDHCISRACSPAYASPNLISNNPYSAQKHDIWCLGVILYISLYSSYPFTNDGIINEDPDFLRVLLRSIINKQPKYSSIVSDQANNLIKLLLIKNEKLRPSIEEILQHPWLQS